MPGIDPQESGKAGNHADTIYSKLHRDGTADAVQIQVRIQSREWNGTDYAETSAPIIMGLPRNERVQDHANVPQIPGCLPQGYDENSLLTVEQYAIWKQLSIRTVREQLAITPGLVQQSSRIQRIHVKTHLAKAFAR